MSDDDKYQNGEFDENFDDLDFDDTELDGDDGIYDDLPEEDFEAEGLDEEWDELDGGEEDQPAGRKGKKEKSLYTNSSERKGFSLSFNTMVIIGALLLGGSVMAYTVMNKTSQVNAGKKESFISSLNIGAVMDGTIFGAKDEPAEQDQQDNSAGENITAPQDNQGGFFDNPDGVAVLDENQPADLTANPPQPSPITPMPDEIVEQVPVIADDGEQIPRGPDETQGADVEMSAQDILNQMKASRENREKEDDQPAIVQTEEPSPVVISEASVAPVQDTAKLEEANGKAAEAQAQVQSMQSTIADLQSQVQGLEGELNTLRGSQSRESTDLEKTVADLQAQLKAAKDAAVKAEKVSGEQAARAEKAAADAKAAKERAASAEAAAKKAAAQKPAPEKVVSKEPAPSKATRKPKPAAAPAASDQWELRAAQPGRAWVSKQGARDMQGVTVGESLPGLGKITGIAYINGRWVVQGTQGQILQ